VGKVGHLPDEGRTDERRDDQPAGERWGGWRTGMRIEGGKVSSWDQIK